MSTKEKVQRNYGIDLLRIISMFMVVVLHVLGQGGILYSTEVLSARYEVAWLLETAAYCAVNCYALISGYVGINSTYKYSSIVLLWLRVVFYSVGISLLFFCFVPDAVSISTLIDSMFPVYNKYYWYFTAYVCLYLFIPIINKAIQSLNRKQLKALVIGLVICFSVLQTLFGDVFGTGNGYSGLWLIILYIIGGYIKKYDALSNMSIWKNAFGYILMILLSWGVKFVFELIGYKLGTESAIGNFLLGKSGILISYTSPTILMAGIFLLLTFKKINLSSWMNRLIKFFSPLAFSIYLIHVHPLVWQRLSGKFASYVSLSYPVLVLAVLGTSITICLICSLVDVIREFIFKKLKLKKRLGVLEEKLVGELWR